MQVGQRRQHDTARQVRIRQGLDASFDPGDPAMTVDRQQGIPGPALSKQDIRAKQGAGVVIA